MEIPGQIRMAVGEVGEALLTSTYLPTLARYMSTDRWYKENDPYLLSAAYRRSLEDCGTLTRFYVSIV